MSHKKSFSRLKPTHLTPKLYRSKNIYPENCPLDNHNEYIRYRSDYWEMLSEYDEDYEKTYVNKRDY